jgi:hypothetical protein
MKPETIQTIAQFLNRVTLQGSEVEAYQMCMQELGRAMQEAQAQKSPSEGAQKELPIED